MNKENISNFPSAYLIEPNEEMAVEFLAMAEQYRATRDERYKSALENLRCLCDWIDN